MASTSHESEVETPRAKRRQSSAAKKGPGRRSLHVTLFASTAAVTLLGLVALAEVSIWQHRALALEALAHDDPRLVEEAPANAPEVVRQDGEAGNGGAEAGVLRIGLDATRVQPDLVASARQTRQTQAIIAAMVSASCTVPMGLSGLAR